MSSDSSEHFSTDKDEFRSFVSAIFDNWSALQLAVDHGMGGSPHESSRKVQDMVDHVTNMTFSSATLDWGDIAAELEDLMDNYFDTILEDGSADELGWLIWDLFRKWSSNDKESVRNYVAKLKNVPCKKHVDCQPVPSSDAAEEMETIEEVDNLEQNDGWTVVKRSGRH